MNLSITRTLQAALLAALAGCASAKQPETACATINREIGGNATTISAVAIRRGNVDKLDVPVWVPGGNKAVTVITNRQTAKIEKLQGEQAGMQANRDQQCR